jgi:hypothetical protein
MPDAGEIPLSFCSWTTEDPDAAESIPGLRIRDSSRFEGHDSGTADEKSGAARPRVLPIKARKLYGDWVRLDLRQSGARVCAAAVSCLAICCAAQANSAALKTSDSRVELRAGSTAPRLVRLTGSPGPAWSNDAEETLPASVEINDAAVPVSWRLKRASGQVGLHKVVFVYESATPHLQLRWEWEARANFGPLEHRIIIENLSGREVWLPMVDSLRLDWRAAAGRDLRNFYVEEGADTPSAEG